RQHLRNEAEQIGQIEAEINAIDELEREVVEQLEKKTLKIYEVTGYDANELKTLSERIAIPIEVLGRICEKANKTIHELHGHPLLRARTLIQEAKKHQVAFNFPRATRDYCIEKLVGIVFYTDLSFAQLERMAEYDERLSYKEIADSVKARDCDQEESEDLIAHAVLTKAKALGIKLTKEQENLLANIAEREELRAKNPVTEGFGYIDNDAAATPTASTPKGKAPTSFYASTPDGQSPEFRMLNDNLEAISPIRGATNQHWLDSPFTPVNRGPLTLSQLGTPRRLSRLPVQNYSDLEYETSSEDEGSTTKTSQNIDNILGAPLKEDQYSVLHFDGSDSEDAATLSEQNQARLLSASTSPTQQPEVQEYSGLDFDGKDTSKKQTSIQQYSSLFQRTLSDPNLTATPKKALPVDQYDSVEYLEEQSYSGLSTRSRSASSPALFKTSANNSTAQQPPTDTHAVEEEYDSLDFG
ncbi:MAG: hypothetical protein KDH94_00235, partial [Coxiellaceae bacterium]|nr:hypothetical protein [Coxiellaceae bacterium]